MDPSSPSLFVTRVVVCLGLLRPVAVLMVPVLARYRSRLGLALVWRRSRSAGDERCHRYRWRRRVCELLGQRRWRLHARTLPPSTKSYVVVPFLNTPCTWVLRLQTIPISLS